MSFRACLLVTAVAFALLLSACGSSKSQQTPTRTGAIVPTMPAGSVFVRTYYVRSGKIAVSGRNLVHTLAVGQASIVLLLGGPTNAERKTGLSTALPENTELKKITTKDGRMTVRFSRNLDRIARAQVVTTLTQFPSARDVVIVTPSGSTRPLDRTDFEALMPAVLIESPIPFAQVRSPLHVSGSSNTFEATSQLELLDANGKLLASKTVTASSGTGTRGTFSVNLRFKAPAGTATLVSYEESAKDGSHIDVVRIPLRISR